MIGLVGAGNMATALARGWGEPVVCTDAIADKADVLAAETGGEAVSGNGELADRADIVILCHKPKQLREVAEQIGGRAKGIVSILGGVPLADIRAAYGDDVPVARVMPSVPVEVRRGVTCHVHDPDGDRDFERRVIELFSRVGPVVTIDESHVDAATGLMSCAPAYWALAVEAQVDAGVRAGVPADLATALVVGGLEGSAALLARGDDTLALRRRVTSPAGMTARGVAALERGGVRAAFDDAMQAVVRG